MFEGELQLNRRDSEIDELYGVLAGLGIVLPLLGVHLVEFVEGTGVGGGRGDRGQGDGGRQAQERRRVTD